MNEFEKIKNVIIDINWAKKMKYFSIIYIIFGLGNTFFEIQNYIKGIIYFIDAGQQIAIIFININKSYVEKFGADFFEKYYYTIFKDFFIHFGFSRIAAIIIQVNNHHYNKYHSSYFDLIFFLNSQLIFR